MEKPLAVANEFIKIARKAGNPPTQMKLQKLIFFAHGWNYAIFGGPLVEEGFQAWKYGPVIPSVYREFKNYGLLGIDKEGTELIASAKGLSWEAPVIQTEQTGALLQKIWEVYGKYTGTQLSAMTHAPGTPWTKAREDHPENAHNIPIPDQLIKEYFKGLATQP